MDAPAFGRRPQRPWYRYAFRVVVGVVLTLVVVLASLAATARAPAQAIERDVDRVPSLPVLVPQELPAGYEYLGLNQTWQRGGEVAAATWLYGAAEHTFRPMVTVCVTRAPIDVVDHCVADGERAVSQHAEQDLEAVVVVPTRRSEREVVDAWRHVRLTTQWRAPIWVSNR